MMFEVKYMAMLKKQSKESLGTKIGKSTKEVCNFLTILFCSLRACGVINWKWYWVMSPIFVSWILVLISLILMGCITCYAVSSDNK